MKSIFTPIFLLSFLILNISITYAAYDVNLKSGASGKTVIELQNFLIQNKYLKASANSNYGPATTAAVKAFQKDYKITQNGQFGPMTRAKAKAVASKNSNTNTTTNNSNSNTTNNTSSTGNSNTNNSNLNTKFTLDKNIKNILAKTFTIGAWVPYWREASGSEEIVRNINKVDIVSPFSYEMTETGTFKDPMKMGSGPYSEMIKVAKANGKLVVPSILWWATGEKGRGDVDFVLRDPDLRGALVYDILAEVDKYGLDGIDIDFENKKAETRDAFSTFLEELSNAMHNKNKILVCTIEARTPSDTEFVIGPDKEKELERSNDFKRIGQACDQVRIMAYDQDTGDKDLNNLRTGAYRPVADIDWVKKVLTLAMRDIEWKKIILGVPTYGYKYEITKGLNGEINSYKRLGSMNWIYADEEAKNRNIKPERHVSGELFYTYYDAEKNKEYLVWYSDSESIRQKAELSKLYKIGGISIFKIDGNNDQSIWSKI